MVVTEEPSNFEKSATTLIDEHIQAHQNTLAALKETDAVLEHAQQVLTEARIKLKNATEKYQERLDGPQNP